MKAVDPDIHGGPPAQADCSAAKSDCRAMMRLPTRCSCCCASSISHCRLSTLVCSPSIAPAASCSCRWEALHTVPTRSCAAATHSVTSAPVECNTSMLYMGGIEHSASRSSIEQFIKHRIESSAVLAANIQDTYPCCAIAASDAAERSAACACTLLSAGSYTRLARSCARALQCSLQ
jgi:hypothetical protein